MDQQLNNVSGIESQMGIVIAFLKDQKKALLKLEEKLDQILDSIKEMQDDIRYLRGKTV